ncbi:hypothetical protein BJX63DRAFT_381481 [Aspergillus granulosus]|uniref:Uncharacterized protein n=1 Tax=Aspergillus granulosus TaxID=176169 RepID=A0ABR4HW25_9EURO
MAIARSICCEPNPRRIFRLQTRTKRSVKSQSRRYSPRQLGGSCGPTRPQLQFKRRRRQYLLTILFCQDLSNLCQDCTRATKTRPRP